MSWTVFPIDDGDATPAALTVTLADTTETVVGASGSNTGVIELGGNYQTIMFEIDRTDASVDALTAFKLEGLLYSGGNWMLLCDTWTATAVTRNLIYSSGNMATMDKDGNMWAMCDVRGVQKIRFKATAANAGADVVLVLQGTATPIGG
jgi:hypothetical protein